MLLPQNGRIAIIDDQFQEVQPLFNILSKRRIPYNYYSGLRIADLPENPDINPISVLFIDLNIVEAQHSSKAVISTLHPILKAVCPGKSKPYFLVVWSKKINEYGADLVAHFNNSRDLKDKKPVKFINLNKSDYFDYVDGLYTFNEESFPNLITSITAEFNDLSLLRNLISWENIVHAKSCETVSEFLSLFPIDAEWDKNSKAVIYHLAKSIIGPDDVDKKIKKIIGEAEQEIPKFSDAKKMAKGFAHINSFLAEKIENEVEELKLGDVKDIYDDKFTRKNKLGRLSSEVRAKINSKIHLFGKANTTDVLEQGNIYVYRYRKNEVAKILFKDRYGNNGNKKQDIIDSKPKLIKLDLTPVCDYAQKKGYVRLLQGLLIDHKFYEEISASEQYFYKTPVFEWNGKIVFMLFDFRFVNTLSEQDIEKSVSFLKFKLRREICTDIQSQLANQVNRPGISNL